MDHETKRRIAPAPTLNAWGSTEPAIGRESSFRLQLKQTLAKLTFAEQMERLSPPGAVATSPVVQREPEPGADAAPVRSGAWGIVTSPHQMSTDDGDIDLAPGDVVQVAKGGAGDLTVKAWSGHAGAKGTLPAAKFSEQPGVSVNEDTGKPENYVYEEFAGELFLAKKSAKTGKRTGKKAPRLEDVAQGYLGDCYLMAAMGAVVAARPDIIREMIAYDAGAKTYSVTFQELQRDGSFKPRVEVVDAFLPSSKGGKALQYAGAGDEFDPKDIALWPAIIEKAYAQWKGGYAKIEGGLAEEVMAEMSGVESESYEIPDDPDEVIDLFKRIQQEKSAACCGSRNYMKETSKTGLFSGSDDGPSTGHLTTDEGDRAELVKKFVSISGGSGGSAKDDGKGAMKGKPVAAGSVDYETGRVELTYKKGKAPQKPEDLKATYRYHGLLSKSLNIHGEHYYIFTKVRGNKIYLHNPWGPDPSYHPKPLTGAEFLKYFDALDVNTATPEEGTR